MQHSGHLPSHHSAPPSVFCHLLVRLLEQCHQKLGLDKHNSRTLGELDSTKESFSKIYTVHFAVSEEGHYKSFSTFAAKGGHRKKKMQLKVVTGKKKGGFSTSIKVFIKLRNKICHFYVFKNNTKKKNLQGPVM